VRTYVARRNHSHHDLAANGNSHHLRKMTAKCLDNEGTAAIYRNAVATFLHCLNGSDEAPYKLAVRYMD